MKLKKFLSNLKYSTLVIALLLMLNGLVISFVVVQTKSDNDLSSHSIVDTAPNKYVSAGALVIDWSYTLIHYFKK